MYVANPLLQKFIDEILKPGIGAMDKEITLLKRRVEILEKEPRVFTLKVEANRDAKQENDQPKG